MYSKCHVLPRLQGHSFHVFDRVFGNITVAWNWNVSSGIGGIDLGKLNYELFSAWTPSLSLGPSMTRTHLEQPLCYT